MNLIQKRCTSLTALLFLFALCGNQTLGTATAQSTWMFHAGTYTHSPETGQRVAQYERIAPVEPLGDRWEGRSIYNTSTTEIRGAYGSTNTYIEVDSYGNGRGGLDAQWERYNDAWQDTFSRYGRGNRRGYGRSYGRGHHPTHLPAHGGHPGGGHPGAGHPGGGYGGGVGGMHYPGHGAGYGGGYGYGRRPGIYPPYAGGYPYPGGGYGYGGYPMYGGYPYGGVPFYDPSFIASSPFGAASPYSSTPNYGPGPQRGNPYTYGNPAYGAPVYAAPQNMVPQNTVPVENPAEKPAEKTLPTPTPEN